MKLKIYSLYLALIFIITACCNLSYAQVNSVEITGPVKPKINQEVQYDLVFKDQQGNILPSNQVAITDITWYFGSESGNDPFISTSYYSAIVKWDAVGFADLIANLWTWDNYLETPTFSIQVQDVVPVPIISASNSGILSSGSSVTLSVGNYSYDTYTWLNSSGNPIAGATGSTFSTSTAGVYKVRVTKGSSTYTSGEKTIINATDAQNLNYVLTQDIQWSGVTDPNNLEGLSSVINNQSLQYFDGLGRPIQSIIKKGSPTSEDIVQPIGYDGLGRATKQYLPYVDGANGLYKVHAIKDPGTTAADELSKYQSGQQFAFYQTQSGVANDTYPYSETILEASPLNRPLKSYGQGANWRDNEKFQKYSYLTNIHGTATGEEKLIAWKIDGSGMPVRNFSSTLNNGIGYYPSGSLYIKSVKDEHGNEVREYNTKEGKLILKKVQAVKLSTNLNNAAHWLSTYYIYDDFGNLRIVLQPKLTEKITQSDSYNPTITDLSELAFQYNYDSRDRVIAKKVPSADWVYMLYDQRDRLVYSQDGNMRRQSPAQWSYTLYDELNRPIQTGIMVYSGTRDALQSNMNNLTISTSSISGSGVSSIPSHLYISEREGSRTLYQASEQIEFAPGFESDGLTAEIVAATSENFNSQQKIYSNPFPAAATTVPLTMTYYDDYDWTEKSFTSAYNPELQNIGTNSYGDPLPTIQNNLVRSLLTGTKVRVISSNDPTQLAGAPWLESASFYDEKGRVVQVISDNYKGGTEVVTSRYDFTGGVLASYSVHNNASGNITNLEVKTTFNYDHGGRLLSVNKKIGGVEKTILKNNYDPLGQLINKKLGEKVTPTGTAPLEEQAFNYNIRGWLKGINWNYATGNNKTQPVVDINNSKWFAMDLSYDWGFEEKQYNGSIAGMRWMSGGDGKERSYGYGYDGVNRLLYADFKQYDDGSWNNNAGIDFSVKMGDGSSASSAYDANGNIKQMQQMGWKIGGSDWIDDLRYTYLPNSNRLQNVTDVKNDKLSTLSDFRTLSSHPYFNQKEQYKTDPSLDLNSITDYSYDDNGNLKKDLNKAIGTQNYEGIEYNYLNLPYRITVEGKGTITYIYDAAGNKQEKITDEGASAANNNTPKKNYTAYLGSYVYENNVLKFFAHEEGRVRYQMKEDGNKSYAYDYFLKDHLGNVRMVLTDELKLPEAYPAATMETALSTKEEQLYTNLSQTRSTLPSGYPDDRTYSDPNTQVAKVNGSGQKIGPGITLKVMAGDRFNARVSSWYKTPGGTQLNAPNPLAELVNALAYSFGSLAGSKATAQELTDNGVLGPEVDKFFANQGHDGSRPKAYLNWILFDEQFKLVASSSGSDQVPLESYYNNGTSTPRVYVHQKENLSIDKNGYLYVYVSNQTPNLDVFFDNLQVTLNHGPLLEENHYYPFGLTMQGISSKAMGSLENKKKFNEGTELNTDFDVNLYETAFRSLDPQLGRFWQIDPLASSSYNLTPYNYGANNPILRNDPLGLKDSVVIHPDGTKEHVDNKSLENVTVYSKGAMKEIYWYLRTNNIPISKMHSEPLKEFLNRYDGIQKHLEGVHVRAHEEDLYVYGTLFSPLLALFATEVAAPMIYQGGQWLVRVGTKYVPLDKVSALYRDGSLWVYKNGNFALNYLRREYLFTMAAILKSNPAQVDNIMKQSNEFKDLMGPIVKAVENRGKNPSPSGSPLPTINKNLNH